MTEIAAFVTDDAAESAERSVERPARLRALARSLLHGRGLVGLVLVAIVVVAGVCAPLLAPYNPTRQLDASYLLTSTARHPLGTDELNRDVLSRVLYGIRTDLLIVAIGVPLGATLGGLVGLVSAGRRFGDVLAQRTFDVILAFPALILGIALAAILGPSALTVIVVIAVAEVPVFGRLVRTQVLSVRERPYVEAATVSGASTGWILRRHVLPNVLEPLVVQLALSLSLGVFIEAGLSYLGVGVTPPTPALGSMLASANDYLETNPAYAFGPLIAISALVLGFYLISQAVGAARRR
ncbi:MAG: ABC transporter permease [Gordonia sp. (in: high G+C Gram-positive bacteria)]